MPAKASAPIIYRLIFIGFVAMASFIPYFLCFLNTKNKEC
jgi:hypothetical protein